MFFGSTFSLFVAGTAAAINTNLFNVTLVHIQGLRPIQFFENRLCKRSSRCSRSKSHISQTSFMEYVKLQMADAEGCRFGGKSDKQDKRKKYKCDSDYVLRKRLPPRLPRRNNDIYITNKSNYQVCICRIQSIRGPQNLHYDEL